MRKTLAAVIAAAFGVGCAPQYGSVPAPRSTAAAALTHPVQDATAFAITDVRVFDGERVWPRATVVVEGERIAYFGETRPSELPAVLIAGREMTLLPGLIDAHVHTLRGEADLRDALRFGVTTILEMANRADAAAALRAIRGRPDVADPYSSGPGATAPGGHGTQFDYYAPAPTISSPDSAEAFVAARVGEGSDFIKIVDAHGVIRHLPTLDRATVEALIRAAHRQGKLAVMHVDRAEDAEAALRAGADGLVHVWRDTGAASSVSALAASRGAFVIPSLAVMEGVWLSAVGGSALRANERLRPFLSDAAVSNLTDSGWLDALPDSILERVRPLTRGIRPNMYAAVRDLHTAGVRILAGSDAPNLGTWHGVSLHRELELLVEAGLSPAEALRAATSATADAFRLPDRGRIAPGLRADLLLVEGDPTVDVTATRAIVGIWKQGQRAERSVPPLEGGP